MPRRARNRDAGKPPHNGPATGAGYGGPANGTSVATMLPIEEARARYLAMTPEQKALRRETREAQLQVIIDRVETLIHNEPNLMAVSNAALAFAKLTGQLIERAQVGVSNLSHIPDEQLADIVARGLGGIGTPPSVE